MGILQPHYVRDYRRLLRTMLRRNQEYDTVMSDMVGGQYEIVGACREAFLPSIGLKSSDYLIDVGCGSVRLSLRSRDMLSLHYLGTDVVPELIEYAIAKCVRPDLQFHVVEISQSRSETARPT